jgi:ADP-ribose pyrophosphatase YjhB (NUDIX family)
MKFCSTCGATVALKVPDGDSLPRYVCVSCNIIHYSNPRMIVGCVPYWEDKVLLCKRAIQPRYGLWTVPAGFMENGETLDIGAARETLEEAGARVDMGMLYAVYSIPHVNQVYLLFLAQLKDLDYQSGAESLDTRLFTQDEIPWDQIAFATVRNTLTHYFADRARGQFKTHVGVIERPPGR